MKRSLPILGGRRICLTNREAVRARLASTFAKPTARQVARPWEQRDLARQVPVLSALYNHVIQSARSQWPNQAS